MGNSVHSIQNNFLSATVSNKGAELQSLILKDFGIEYMWSGDPAFWGKKSPVLFPIVGGLKNNSYTHNGQHYQMGRHGFARDMEFELSHASEDTLIFTLHNNNATEKVYPFQFAFSVTYQLQENSLRISYSIKNKGEDMMFFSVGAHPAFAVPLIQDTTFEDYYLEFERPESAPIWPLSPEGQIEMHPVPYFEDSNVLPLKKSLFYKDALVFKHLASHSISIKSAKTSHGLKVHFENFPYMGIWNAKDADFVCIEPWCGIADNVAASGILSEKEGINPLPAEHVFHRTWSIEVF